MAESGSVKLSEPDCHLINCFDDIVTSCRHLVLYFYLSGATVGQTGRYTYRVIDCGWFCEGELLVLIVTL